VLARAGQLHLHRRLLPQRDGTVCLCGFTICILVCAHTHTRWRVTQILDNTNVAVRSLVFPGSEPFNTRDFPMDFKSRTIEMDTIFREMSQAFTHPHSHSHSHPHALMPVWKVYQQPVNQQNYRAMMGGEYAISLTHLWFVLARFPLTCLALKETLHGWLGDLFLSRLKSLLCLLLAHD
jgi:hypothetical protein